MVTRIYALGWLLAAGTASLFYFTGSLNELTFTLLGFIFSTLVFIGLVVVLPWWVDKQYTWEYTDR